MNICDCDYTSASELVVFTTRSLMRDSRDWRLERGIAAQSEGGVIYAVDSSGYTRDSMDWSWGERGWEGRRG